MGCLEQPSTAQDLKTAKRQGVWPQPALPPCVRHPRRRLRMAPTHFSLTLLLLQRVASQELHITEEELEQRLQQVFNLLPGERSMRAIIPQNPMCVHPQLQQVSSLGVSGNRCTPC